MLRAEEPIRVVIVLHICIWKAARKMKGQGRQQGRCTDRLVHAPPMLPFRMHHGRCVSSMLYRLCPQQQFNMPSYGARSIGGAQASHSVDLLDSSSFCFVFPTGPFYILLSIFFVEGHFLLGPKALSKSTVMDGSRNLTQIDSKSQEIRKTVTCHCLQTLFWIS
jgi:hypothetical protein